MFGDLFLSLLCRLYLDDKQGRHIKHIRSRLFHLRSSRASQRPMSTSDIARDRLRLIYHMLKNIRYFDNECTSRTGSYLVSPLSSAKVDQYANVIVNAKPDLCTVMPAAGQSKLNLQRMASYFSDLLLSLLGFFDLNHYELYPLYSFFRKRNVITAGDVAELHIFGFYNPSCYLLCSLPHQSIETYVYSGNAPLNYPHKHGYFKGLRFVVSNPSQAKEIEILNDRGDIILKDTEVLLGKNHNQSALAEMPVVQRYDVGFFSEGWWLRRDGDGFSIEDVQTLRRHLLQPKQPKARMESQLFTHLARATKDAGFSLALYLHPCEERAIGRGFDHPYAALIDDQTCFYGTKKDGISNLHEARLAITMLPSASIITDRSALDMATLYCSRSMLMQHDIDEKFEKLYRADTEREFNDLAELDRIIASSEFARLESGE